MNERENLEGVATSERNSSTVTSALTPSPLELELAEFIISTLALEDVSASDIPPEKSLFGDGLGLDSVDALELAVALQKQYGVKLDPKDEKSITALSNVRNLSQLITEHRALSSAS